eukprot:TRINITY_DN50972_c0_g1_i5.p1 TRINITY_DN50972_c0_g1~~TRINITY_DN50972_c0_g1_i5.p1  ORF type:complete len:2505 (-),score=627.39 TRINITY_DN50972_c0_g1_i5:196-7710(-)
MAGVLGLDLGLSDDDDDGPFASKGGRGGSKGSLQSSKKGSKKPTGKKEESISDLLGGRDSATMFGSAPKPKRASASSLLSAMGGGRGGGGGVDPLDMLSREVAQRAAPKPAEPDLDEEERRFMAELQKEMGLAGVAEASGHDASGMAAGADDDARSDRTTKASAAPAAPGKAAARAADSGSELGESFDDLVGDILDNTADPPPKTAASARPPAAALVGARAASPAAPQSLNASFRSDGAMSQISGARQQSPSPSLREPTPEPSKPEQSHVSSQQNDDWDESLDDIVGDIMNDDDVKKPASRPSSKQSPPPAATIAPPVIEPAPAAAPLAADPFNVDLNVGPKPKRRLQPKSKATPNAVAAAMAPQAAAVQAAAAPALTASSSPSQVATAEPAPSPAPAMPAALPAKLPPSPDPAKTDQSPSQKSDSDWDDESHNSFDGGDDEKPAEEDTGPQEEAEEAPGPDIGGEEAEGAPPAQEAPPVQEPSAVQESPPVQQAPAASPPESFQVELELAPKPKRRLGGGGQPKAKAQAPTTTAPAVSDSPDASCSEGPPTAQAVQASPGASQMAQDSGHPATSEEALPKVQQKSAETEREQGPDKGGASGESGSAFDSDDDWDNDSGDGEQSPPPERDDDGDIDPKDEDAAEPVVAVAEPSADAGGPKSPQPRAGRPPRPDSRAALEENLAAQHGVMDRLPGTPGIPRRGPGQPSSGVPSECPTDMSFASGSEDRGGESDGPLGVELNINEKPKRRLGQPKAKASPASSAPGTPGVALSEASGVSPAPTPPPADASRHSSKQPSVTAGSEAASTGRQSPAPADVSVPDVAESMPGGTAALPEKEQSADASESDWDDDFEADDDGSKSPTEAASPQEDTEHDDTEQAQPDGAASQAAAPPGDDPAPPQATPAAVQPEPSQDSGANYEVELAVTAKPKRKLGKAKAAPKPEAKPASPRDSNQDVQDPDPDTSRADEAASAPDTEKKVAGSSDADDVASEQESAHSKVDEGASGAADAPEQIPSSKDDNGSASDWDSDGSGENEDEADDGEEAESSDGAKQGAAEEEEEESARESASSPPPDSVPPGNEQAFERSATETSSPVPAEQQAASPDTSKGGTAAAAAQTNAAAAEGEASAGEGEAAEDEDGGSAWDDSDAGSEKHTQQEVPAEEVEADTANVHQNDASEVTQSADAAKEPAAGPAVAKGELQEPHAEEAETPQDEAKTLPEEEAQHPSPSQREEEDAEEEEGVPDDEDNGWDDKSEEAEAAEQGEDKEEPQETESKDLSADGEAEAEVSGGGAAAAEDDTGAAEGAASTAGHDQDDDEATAASGDKEVVTEGEPEQKEEQEDAPAVQSHPTPEEEAASGSAPEALQPKALEKEFTEQADLLELSKAEDKAENPGSVEAADAEAKKASSSSAPASPAKSSSSGRKTKTSGKTPPDDTKSGSKRASPKSADEDDKSDLQASKAPSSKKSDAGTGKPSPSGRKAGSAASGKAEKSAAAKQQGSVFEPPSRGESIVSGSELPPKLPPSPCRTKTPPVRLPGALQKPQLDIVDSQTLKVSWQPVQHTPEVTGYQLVVRNGCKKYFDAESGHLVDDVRLAKAVEPSQTSAVLKALPGQEQYSVEVAATIAGGLIGEYSPRSDTVSLEVPVAPAAPKLEVLDATRIRVSWACEEADACRLPALGYMVFVHDGADNYYDPATCSLLASSTGIQPLKCSSVVVQGLAVGVECMAAIAAVNDIGWSPYSSCCDRVVIDVPAPPHAPNVVATDGSTLSISWVTAPESTGVVGYGLCLALQSVTMKYYDSVTGALVDDPGLANPVAASTSSVCIKGVSAGVRHKARLTAINNVGWGKYSEFSKSVTIEPPKAPATPSLAVVSASSVHISWEAVEHAPPVIGYAIAVQDGDTLKYFDSRTRTIVSDNAGLTPVPASRTSATLLQLIPGKRYRAKLAACNAVGWSAYSKFCDFVSLRPPEPIAAPALEIVDSSRIRISWPHSFDAASFVDGYAIGISRQADGHAEGSLRYFDPSTGRLSVAPEGLLPIAAEQHAVVVEGLHSEVRYSAKIAARNKTGWGKYSPFSSCLQISTPPRPEKPMVRVCGPSAVRVSWWPVAHAPSVVGYVVAVDDGCRQYVDARTQTLVGHAWGAGMIPGERRSVLVPEVTSVSTCKFSVAAVNEVGFSEFSEPRACSEEEGFADDDDAGVEGTHLVVRVDLEPGAPRPRTLATSRYSKVCEDGSSEEPRQAASARIAHVALTEYTLNLAACLNETECGSLELQSDSGAADGDDAPAVTALEEEAEKAISRLSSQEDLRRFSRMRSEQCLSVQEALARLWCVDEEMRSGHLACRLNRALLADMEEQLRDWEPVLRLLGDLRVNHERLLSMLGIYEKTAAADTVPAAGDTAHAERSSVLRLWRGSKLSERQVGNLRAGEVIRPPMFLSATSSKALAEVFSDHVIVELFISCHADAVCILSETPSQAELVLRPYTPMRILDASKPGLVQVEVLSDAGDAYSAARAFPL